jgi:hypothetical protein
VSRVRRALTAVAIAVVVLMLAAGQQYVGCLPPAREDDLPYCAEP